jgi:hypothetical protein
MRSFLAAIFLLAAAVPLAAQGTQNASMTASIRVLSPISFVTGQNLDFGTHFTPTSGTSVVTCQGVGAVGRWDGFAAPGQVIDVSISRPASLQRVGNTATLAFVVGSDAALLRPDGGPSVHFNPAGLSGYTLPTGGSGGFSIELCSTPASADQDIQVSIPSGAASGTYQGTLVATVVQH